ncbi:DUF4157 domain-containing protein [Nocardia sp. NPDC049149]|uniref:eCIS core domain-containing protein n=1 Tax=Nocardia sp. NPDC049149 TaxID=3364315 RepID=UPI00371A8E18
MRQSDIRPPSMDIDLTAVPATPGAPLEPATRREMETRFGADFGDVRVHLGSSVSAATRQLHASAFTVGRDIAFRDGTYQPGTPAGDHLLAHELAHVVQQRRGGVAADSAHLEHGAQQAAGSYADGGSITVAGAGPQQVSCQNEDDEEWKKKQQGTGDPYRTPGQVPPKERPGFPPPRPKPDKPLDLPPTFPPVPAVPTAPVPTQDPGTYPPSRRRKDPPPFQQEQALPEEISSEPGARQKIADALKEAGVPAWAAAALTTAVIAWLAYPEPFGKIAGLIGVAAATAFLILIGRSDAVPPSGPSA